MSTYTPARTRRQRDHVASRGKSHCQDKAQGEARRKTDWLGVEAPPRPSPERVFPGLEGHEYRFDGKRWSNCAGPEEFADYLENQARQRSWYIDQTVRKGTPVKMKRRVKTPVEILTATFPPWLSDWMAKQFGAKKDPRPQLAIIRTTWLKRALAALAGERYVLGYAFHADTADCHFDLCVSRQNGSGERIGSPGLRLVGPWCVGVDRQVRAGADIHGEKRSQFRRNIANFRHRYGESAKPLDVLLARNLDEAAAEVIGAELTLYLEAYAQRVPDLERRHAAAKRAVLESALAKMTEQAEPGPESEIDFSL